MDTKIKENVGMNLKSGEVVNELSVVGEDMGVQLDTYENKDRVMELSRSIEPLDNDKLLSYGSEAQDSLTKFSDSMLRQVQDTDVGDVGVNLDKLMKKLKMVDPEELTKEPTFFDKLFKKTKKRVEDILNRHSTISDEVDRISIVLSISKEELTRDVRLLDGLYEENKKYFEEISLYIKGAEVKRDELNNEVLPKLKEKAQNSSNQMDVQDVNDMTQYINRLDKRIHDLKLSRQIALQSAPQIRLVQDVNQTLAERIQSSVLTSIPLWKNQMAISLTLLRQETASKSQKLVTDTTNDLLLKNSEMLKQNAIRTANENERGIVDIDTLKKTQNNLVTTIEETLRIQHEGSEKRRNAEKELEAMEKELKNKLLDIKDKYR